MALDVMSMIARLGMDKSEYDKEMKEAETGFKGFGSKLKSGVQNVAKIAAGAAAAGAAAITAVTAAVTKGVSEVAAYGDNIDKASQKLGISAQAYQEWDAVMQHSGTSIDSLGTGMKTLSTKAAEGSDAFKKLGISQKEAAKMSREELFSKTITALQNVQDANKKAQLAQELFGKSAMELGPLLNTSAEDTKAMKDQVHALGGVLSDEAVKASAAYQDTLQDMNTAMDGVKRGLFASFLPSVTKVMQGITDLFTGSGGADKIRQGVNDFITNMGKTLPGMLKKGLSIAKAVGGAVVGAIPDVVKRITRALPKIWNGVKAYVSTSLFPAISNLITSVLGRGNTSVMSEQLSKTFGSIFNKLISVVEKIGEKVAEFWDTVLKPILGDIVEFVLFYVLPVADQVIEAVSPVLEWLSEKTSVVFEGISKLWNSVVLPAIMGAISVESDIWENVKKQNWAGVGKTIWNAIKGGFNAVNGWLLKLVLGDDYTPESGWGEAGAKIWSAIKTGFAVANDWLIKLLMGDKWKPESGWGDVGSKIWSAIKTGFAVVNGWLLKLVLGDNYTPESGWGQVGAQIWSAIKDGFAVVNGWLIKLVLGDDYTPDAGWGEVGSQIWSAIKDGFNVVNGWLLKQVIGENYTPESGWSEAGGQIWENIKNGFKVTSDWLIKLVLGDEWTPESGWGEAGAKVWDAIKTGFAITSDWLKRLLLGEDEWTPDATWADVGSKIWGKIIEGLSSAVNWLKDIFDGWTEKLTDGSVDFASIGFTIGSTIWDAIASAFSTVVEWFKNLFGGSGEEDQNGVLGAIYSIDWAGLGTSIFNFIGAAFDGVAGVFEGWFQSVYDKIKDIDWAGLGNAMWSAITGAFDSISDWFVDTFRAPINIVIDYINEMITNFENAYNRVIEGINYLLGTNFERRVFDRVQRIYETVYGTDQVEGGGGGAERNGEDYGRKKIKKYAKGGILREGERAFVGEYAPEFLQVIGGRAVVTPLSSTPGRYPGGGEEVVVPRNNNRDITIILELDRQQFGKAVYKANNDETQRVGVRMATGGAY